MCISAAVFTVKMLIGLCPHILHAVPVTLKANLQEKLMMGDPPIGPEYLRTASTEDHLQNYPVYLVVHFKLRFAGHSSTE